VGTSLNHAICSCISVAETQPCRPRQPQPSYRESCSRDSRRKITLTQLPIQLPMEGTSQARAASVSPSGLLNLPTEILYQIVQDISQPFLDPALSPDLVPTPTAANQALQTLAHLTLTCHRLHDVTLPILYREFSLGYTDIPGTHFTPQMGQRTAEFTRTLLERRDLASLVKHAFLHPKLVELMGEENREVICALAKKVLRRDEEHVWADDQQPIEVLFFALMPNLERLVLAACSWIPPISIALREVAWKKLKGLEMVDEYGWSFSEGLLVKKYEEELINGIWYGIPDEDDDL